MHLPPLALVLYFTIVSSVTVAFPTWQSVFQVNMRNRVNSLVSGAFPIEVLATDGSKNARFIRHLSLPSPGLPGNLTVTSLSAQDLPLFYIYNKHLWQYNNDTSILYVNALNTDTALQLVVGNKPEGISEGTWRWRGTMLYYDQGVGDPVGVFYLCKRDDRSAGVFMFLKPLATPTGCEMVTLHSQNSKAD